jgi:hypothetical protein
MLAATTLNLLFIPILYVTLRMLQERVGGRSKPKGRVEEGATEERVTV